MNRHYPLLVLPISTVFLLCLVLMVSWSTPVLADGTEVLGPPQRMSLTAGSGMIAAGTGLSTTLPATLNISVPTNSQVRQVLVYWSGGMDGEQLGSNTVQINGQTITGRAIGGPTYFFSRRNGEINYYFSAFRADVTALGLIKPGDNSLSIESQPFDGEKDGIGVMVIYDDGTGNARIQLRDGIDLAYHNFPKERQVAVPQTFTFPATTQDRTARMSMFFGSVAPEEPRSSIFTITVDNAAPVVETNLIGSFDGAQWDTVNIDFLIPTGATSVTVEAKSPPNAEPDGASFSWIATGFYLLNPSSEIRLRKYTNGIDADDRNASDVPNIAPGDPVTWTYVVTNTGNITFSRSDVNVTDNQPGISPQLDVSSDNGDGLLSPGEQWTFVATGMAEDLSAPAAGVMVRVGCLRNGVYRPVYRNVGRVTVPNADDENHSYYCNPPEPGITIQKHTNGFDADDADGADVPLLLPGETVEWSYIVTNTGNLIYPRSTVVVTDSHQGVTPVWDRSSDVGNDRLLSPGESWVYTATGTVENLRTPSQGVTVVAGCTGVNKGGPEQLRTYENIGSVSVPDLSATDPSHYCNPPPTALAETDEPEEFLHPTALDAVAEPEAVAELAPVFFIPFIMLEP